MPRSTVQRPTTVIGVGLHTGVPTTMTIRSGEDGAGIQFRRVDVGVGPWVSADLDAVSGTERSTRLGADGQSIATVEHFLSAAAGLAYDDLRIEVDGPELPAGDGSARVFVAALTEAGRQVTQAAAKTVRLDRTLTVAHGKANYVVVPRNTFEIDVTIEWNHPLIGRQQGRYTVTPESYTAELAGARTFGFVADLEALRARGLAAGAGLENTIALTQDGLLGGTLRWPDEFVRHKALDLVGDLALLGRPVQARVEAFRPSHAGNHAVARAIRAAVQEPIT